MDWHERNEWNECNKLHEWIHFKEWNDMTWHDTTWNALREKKNMNELYAANDMSERIKWTNQTQWMKWNKDENEKMIWI